MPSKAKRPQPSPDRNKLPPIELYTPQRRAEFLLSNSIDAEDYRRARRLVEAMGFDPDQIRHTPPEV